MPPPETSQRPGLSDPENEANNEQIILEKTNQYFESEDEDEQGYIRQEEELEDIYWDDQLPELEVDELERSLKLVIKDQMERIEKRKRDHERLHGPGYQALFMVDNSQGHAAYASDALLVTKMNLNPGVYEGCQRHTDSFWLLNHPLHLRNPLASY